MWVPMIPLLFWLALLPGGATAAEDMREAVYRVDKDEGSVQIPHSQKTCRKFDRDQLRFTFPVNGGPVQGRWVGSYSSLVEMKSISGFLCIAGDHDYQITGRFEGGDGGQLRATCTNVKDSKSTACGGRLYAKGTGTFQLDGDKDSMALTFPPFGGTCNTDLNAYEKELQKQLLNALMDASSQHVFKSLGRVAVGLRDDARQLYRLWKIQTGRYQDLLDGLTVKPPLSLFERAEQGVFNASVGPNQYTGVVEELPLWKAVREIGENASKGLAALEVANAAIEGSYSQAAMTAVIEAVGSYSNAAGLAIAAAQATYADWQAFEQRYHDEEFKRLYKKIYYEAGPRPAENRWKAERSARLRAFVQEVYDWLDYGGLQGDRVRKLLIDYAYYTLEMRLSRDDFKLVTRDDGSLGLADPRATATLGSLFVAFEALFEKDAESELLRRVALRQSRRMSERATRAEEALRRAGDRDYSGVWPDPAERQGQVCKVIERVRAEAQQQPHGPARK